MTLLTVFFLGSLHGPECAEVARQRPRGGQQPSQARVLRTCASSSAESRSSPRAFSPRSAQRSALSPGPASPLGSVPWGMRGEWTGDPTLDPCAPSSERTGAWEGRKAPAMRSNAERGVHTDRSALPGGTEVKSQLQRGKRLPRAGLTSVSCGVFSETSPKAYFQRGAEPLLETQSVHQMWQAVTDGKSPLCSRPASRSSQGKM